MAEPMIKSARLKDLIEKDFPVEPTWIGPSVLPKNCKMIIGGEAAIGKSFIMLEMARGLALGEAPFENPFFKVDKPARILLIEHELKPYGLQKRVKPLFTPEELDRVENTFNYISGEPSLEFSSADGRKRITDAAMDYKPDVLFLDPIGKMHYFSENDAALMAKLMHYMDTLLRLGADWGMSLVFTHHFGKPPKGPGYDDHDPLDAYNFRGSAKFKDDPDTRVTVNRLKNLPKPWESWRLKTRWLTRHGESLSDMYFKFNENQDLRVKYEKSDERGGTVPTIPGSPSPDLPPMKKDPVAPPPAERDPNLPPPKSFEALPSRR